MIQDVVIKILNKHEDDRGWLSEIYRIDETFFRPKMAYVSVTKPGVSRGPHEHKFQSDCFVFVGPGNFDLYLWDNRKESSTFEQHVEIQVGSEKPTMVIVPPGVVHGYKCTSKEDAFCINLPDELYRGEKKTQEVDEIRWELVSDCKFKI